MQSMRVNDLTSAQTEDCCISTTLAASQCASWHFALYFLSDLANLFKNKMSKFSCGCKICLQIKIRLTFFESYGHWSLANRHNMTVKSVDQMTKQRTVFNRFRIGRSNLKSCHCFSSDFDLSNAPCAQQWLPPIRLCQYTKFPENLESLLGYFCVSHLENAQLERVFPCIPFPYRLVYCCSCWLFSYFDIECTYVYVESCDEKTMTSVCVPLHGVHSYFSSNSNGNTVAHNPIQ